MVALTDLIVRDAAICGGEAVFKGTRVTLRTVLASVADRDSVEQIVQSFPTLSEQQVTAAIAFAAASAQEDLPLPETPGHGMKIKLDENMPIGSSTVAVPLARVIVVPLGVERVTVKVLFAVHLGSAEAGTVIRACLRHLSLDIFPRISKVPASQNPRSDMTTTVTSIDNTAHGKISVARDGIVFFSPSGTNYEMHLACPKYAGVIGVPVRGIIRVKARKIYTVSSGGLFVTPIFGPPRIIQGRIRALTQKSMVLHAGGNIMVDFPEDDAAFEMVNGPLAVGKMANVVAWPGATFEPK